VEEPELSLDTFGHDKDDDKEQGEQGEEDPESGLSSLVNVDKVGRRVRAGGTLRERRRQGTVAGVVAMVVSVSVSTGRNGTFGHGDRVSRYVRVGDGQGGCYSVEEIHDDDGNDEVF
jgi:hypothetical protein